MRSALVVSTFLLGVVFRQGCMAGPSYMPIDTLDFSKVHAQEKTNWLENAFWPTEGAISSLKYTGDVTPEKQELRNFLNKTVMEGYRPSDEDLNKNTVAVSRLHDNIDYLLLKYKTKAGVEVSIQDGNNFYLMITLPDSMPLAKVESLVKNTAKSVLNLSELSSDAQDRPGVMRHLEDIGQSAFGQLRYGYSEITKEPEWYTGIPWWSDGKRVMFFISKFNYRELPTMQFMPPFTPRVFKSHVIPAGENLDIYAERNAENGVREFVPDELTRFNELRDTGYNQATAEAAVELVKSTKKVWLGYTKDKSIPSRKLSKAEASQMYAWVIAIQVYEKTNDASAKSVILNEWNSWMEDKPEAKCALRALSVAKGDKSFITNRFITLFGQATDPEMVNLFSRTLGKYGDDAEEVLIKEKIMTVKSTLGDSEAYNVEILNLEGAIKHIEWRKQGDTQRAEPQQINSNH